MKKEIFIMFLLGLFLIIGCVPLNPERPGGCGNTKPEDPQTPPDGVTLSVNDGNGVGTIGDDLLSLAEAIALANGELSMDALSTMERARVSGQPGADSADRIQVDVARVTLPASTPTASALPRLINNDHDHLDGQGAILRESGRRKAVGTAFIAASSFLTIENFVFDNLWRGMLIDPQGPVEVHDVTVRRNRFLRISGSGVEVNGSRTGSGGSLREIAIDENEFDLPTALTSFSHCVAIRSCQIDSPDDIKPVAGGTLSGVWLEGIYVRNNIIHGGAESIVVNVASIHGKGEISDCGLRRLVINDNDLGGSFDMLVNINVAITYAFSTDIADFGADTGTVGPPGSAAVMRDIVLEDVEIARNTMASAQTAALSLYSGIQSISAEDPNLTRIEGCALRKVRIKDNTHKNLQGERTMCSGINVIAGHFDYVSGGLSAGNEVSNIEIAGNTFSGCESGIRVGAAEVIGGGGESRGNRITDVKILDNKVSDNDFGLQLIGAEGMPPSALFATFGLGFPHVGTLEDNIVERVEVRDNVIEANGIGLELIGARATTDTPNIPGDILHNNALKDVTFAGNTIANNTGGDCVAEADMMRGGGVVEGNIAPRSCP